MMQVCTKLLLVLSNALLVPVVVLLLLFFAVTVLYLGGMAAEAAVRWRRGPAFWRLVRELKSSVGRRVRAEEIPARFGLVALAARDLAGTAASPDKTLAEIELEAERILGRLTLGVRLGPMLGLAGTLIPLGPALEAVPTGNLAALSSNLIVAFTTTVIGLAIAAGCFTMHAIRRRWYQRDLNDLEFVVSRLEASHA